MQKKKKFSLGAEKVRVDIRIPKELKDNLEQYCQKNHQSITSAIIEAIKKHIK
jgi:hypothetical protein